MFVDSRALEVPSDQEVLLESRSMESLLDFKRKGQLCTLPLWEQEAGLPNSDGDLIPVTHFLE